MHKKLHYLPKAQIFTLSVVEDQLLQEHSVSFKKFGFIIEHFQNNMWKLVAVPALLQDRDCGALIRDILDDLAQEKNIKPIDALSNHMLAYLACHAAIKKETP